MKKKYTIDKDLGVMPTIDGTKFTCSRCNGKIHIGQERYSNELRHFCPRCINKSYE